MRISNLLAKGRGAAACCRPSSVRSGPAQVLRSIETMVTLVDRATVPIDRLGKPALGAQDAIPAVAKDGGERAAGSPARHGHQRHEVDGGHGDTTASSKLHAGAAPTKINGIYRHADRHVGGGSRRCAEERKPQDDGQWDGSRERAASYLRTMTTLE